jgi:hypothetical protein
MGVRMLTTLPHPLGGDGTVWCPPLVLIGENVAGYLLAWEQHERDDSWYAIVTWIRARSNGLARHQRMVVAVRAANVRPLEPPSTYRQVPRRVLRRDGSLREWAPPSARDERTV